MRPPHAELLGEIQQLGYEAVGRKHGVSGNAVRKWIRDYERAKAAAEGRDPGSVVIQRHTWPRHDRRDAA